MVYTSRRRAVHRVAKLFCALILLVCGTEAAEILDAGNSPNTPEQRRKPYVLLVSLDGFRHDYAQRYGATNLLRFAEAGVRAEGLVPVYPSLTFPSHYSLITGQRPEKHGLVGMRFFDPASKRYFSYTDRSCLTDGHWFGGTPLWVLAEKQGMRSAAFFWVGSEAEIQGVRPSIYARYDAKTPNRERSETVLRWFQLPEESRPHFVMLYFLDADVAGHEFGPDSPEVKASVRRLDEEMGFLLDGLRRLPFEINVLVVSDHGMAERQEERILLYQLVDLTGVVAQSNGSHAAIYSTDTARIESLYQQLSKDRRFSVYRRRDVPKHLHFSGNERIGDLVLIPNGPYLLNVTPPSGKLPGGMHGYDPTKFPDMNGIFFASGPNLAKRVKAGPLDSLDVYPLIARILGLTPPGDIDGKFENVRDLYSVEP